MRHVIIGSGAAGIAAAKTIRSINKDDEIIMVSSDDVIYSRCMLHKYLENNRDISSLNFVSDDFFSVNNIIWHKGKCATRVDTKNNCILLQDTTLSYDKLLIATGSDPVIPNVGKFRTATNVYGFRHLTDAEIIREKAKHAKKIIIIGAGLVGLDIAYALLELKKTLTVIEMVPQIMPLNLDSATATVYQKLFEQNGCNFKLNSKITNTISNEKGEITHVILETGENLTCDMIIMAAGVKPSVKFLEESNVKCEQGVKVDQYLRTSCENVYAAGDVTALGGIWSCAVKQGEVVAKNMCGIKTQFTDTFTAKNTINFFNLPTVSVGNINPTKDDTTLIRESHTCYQKIILRNSSIIGAILQGNIAHSGIWQYLIKNEVDISKLKKPVWDISFADFYGIDEKGQYTYNCI
ncbi:MAG: FAD-dependent oxidoreductase [Candidatus Bathyarchaeota archaeon]|nr:FAD-dependent oxidoreductase [Candidatus Termiticorpusculum sp.]